MNTYFDGGCKPNPGRMEIAVVIDASPALTYHERLGHGTNNEAEWLALLWAMEIAIAQEHKAMTFIGDSTLIINQALGLWRVKHEPLRPFLTEFKVLREHFADIKLKFVPRRLNLAGHHIERMNKGVHGNAARA